MILTLAYFMLGTLLLGVFAEDTVSQIGINDSLWYPYDEALVLKPLPNNDLLLSFAFQLQSEPFDPAVSSMSYDAYEHYTTFPRAIVGIYCHASVSFKIYQRILGCPVVGTVATCWKRGRCLRCGIVVASAGHGSGTGVP